MSKSNVSTVERVLKEAIINTKNEMKNVDLQIQKLALEREALSADLKEFIEEIQIRCKHINTHKVDGPYYEGGYLDKSESHYTIECLDCGKVLESKCIRGTYA